MKRTIFAAIIAIVSITAHANPYVTVNVGSTAKSAFASLGVGAELTNTIALEADYRHFGSISDTGQAIALNYDRNTNTCNGSTPCVFQHNDVQSKMSGIGLSAVYTPHLSDSAFKPYLRVGAFQHTVTTDTTYAPLLALAPTSVTERGVKPFVGLGVNISGFLLEFNDYGSIMTSAQGNVNMRTMSAGYEFKF